MRIIELKAERFKRLRAVEITPEKNMVIVSGRNGQGKSSVLDAIWLALGGGSAAKDSATTRPVKDCETDALVRLNLGDIVVTRKWTSGGTSTLTVESSDGKRKFSSPQAVLDTLVGSISFDPLSFARMDPKDQRRQLIALTQLSINPDELDARRRALYDDRTSVNRDKKAYEAELSNMQQPAKDIPDEETSLTVLIKQLDLAQIEAAACVLNEEKLKGMRERAASLNEEIKQKQEELKKLIEDGKTLAEQVKNQVSPDIAGLKDKVTNAEKNNQSVRQKKHYMEVKAKAEERSAQSEDLSRQIEDIDRAKEQAFKDAKFPIEGLAFDEDGITFKGIPLKQCSSAEQMKVCIAIAAALNPTIRVIRVADASLLDDDSMAVVQQMATEMDIQVWLERVTDGTGSVGVTIEDGSVKE